MVPHYVGGPSNTPVPLLYITLNTRSQLIIASCAINSSEYWCGVHSTLAWYSNGIVLVSSLIIIIRHGIIRVPDKKDYIYSQILILVYTREHWCRIICSDGASTGSVGAWSGEDMCGECVLGDWWWYIECHR